MTPTPTHTAVQRFSPSSDGRRISDADFTHDALLTIDGDFGDEWARHAYAKRLCDVLNAALAQAERPPALGGDDFETWWRSAGFTGDLTHMIAAKFAAHRAWCAVLARQDSRPSSVAPGGQPLAQADSKDDVRWTLVYSLVASKGWMRGYAEAYVDAALSGDSVLPPVEPPGATLSPCAASTAITPAIADALAKARVFALCALRRDGYRFTFHDEAERWAELLLESVDNATSQVDRGESSSERGAA